ncbi:MAG: hypothetical protein ACXVFX_22000, partial [Blastococcus sp.]
MCPTESGLREAPTTAIVRGLSSRAIDWNSARCSRARITSTECSVGSMSKVSRISLPSTSRSMRYPAS